MAGGCSVVVGEPVERELPNNWHMRFIWQEGHWYGPGACHAQAGRERPPVVPRLDSLADDDYIGVNAERDPTENPAALSVGRE
jgi:hypothetical protein